MGATLSSLVFQPPSLSYVSPRGINYVWIRTKNNFQLPAFYIDAHSSVTILFSHGNAEDLAMIYDWFQHFSWKLKVNVLAYEYRGYGNAGGHATESNCYEDIQTAYYYLVQQLQVPSSNIVLYGRSLGTGPTLYLAQQLQERQVRLGGVILQSAFLSVLRVAFPLRFTLQCDLFPNIDRVGSLRVPTLFIHGTRDEVVPFSGGQELFLLTPAHCRAKPLWVHQAGHNNLEAFYEDEEAFFNPLRDFLLLSLPGYASFLLS
ncbi:alpha/beta hydrolase [archaeon]|nr:MAG: alpha/beta hydrolase [archaeon]